MTPIRLGICSLAMAVTVGGSALAEPLAGSAEPERRLVSVTAIGSDDVWAVGWSTTTGRLTPLAMHWDGTSWTDVATPDLGSRSRFTGVSALSSDDVWAVGASNLIAGPDHVYSGRTLVEHWDGQSWRRVRSPNPTAVETNELSAVSAIASDDVWAVGDRYYSDEEPPITMSLHWNGARWRWVKSGLEPGDDSALLAVSGSAGSDVWALGRRGYPSGAWAQHWDGAGWKEVRVPGSDESRGVTVISPSDAWAVTGVQTVHWNGTAWRVVASPGIGTLQAMDAAAVDDVWAVAGHRIEHWNGEAWRRIKSPSDGRLTGLDARTAEDAWAVGHNGDRTRIEHWDGQHWSIVDSA